MRGAATGLVWFFAIACIPPWIGWSLLRFGVAPSDGPWQALYLTGWGVSVGGLVATYLEQGRSGVRRMLREAVRVSVPLRWWLFVLLVPVLAVAASAVSYAVLSGTSIGFAPSALLQLVAPSMLITLLLGPIGEELGWRGYLVPRLTKTTPVLPVLLVVGVITAIWHWPLLSHEAFVAHPLRQSVTLLAGATYMSIVIGAAYLRSGSLLLAILMHWEINNARDLAERIFPGLPDEDSLLQWCAVAANLLVAACTVPALLAAGRAGHPRREPVGA